MAEEKEAGDKAGGGAKAGGGGKLGWIITAIVAGGLGAVVPYFLPADLQPGHGQAAMADSHAEAPPSPAEVTKPAEVDFGQVVVNLDEGRLNTYLQVNIKLQVSEKDKETITTKVDASRAVLTNWLISYLSDQDKEDIRGSMGQNRLRREICDQFNTVLFPDGYDRIDQVLFTQFVVQQ